MSGRQGGKSRAATTCEKKHSLCFLEHLFVLAKGSESPQPDLVDLDRRLNLLGRVRLGAKLGPKRLRLVEVLQHDLRIAVTQFHCRSRAANQQGNLMQLMHHLLVVILLGLGVVRIGESARQGFVRLGDAASLERLQRVADGTLGETRRFGMGRRALCLGRFSTRASRLVDWLWRRRRRPAGGCGFGSEWRRLASGSRRTGRARWRRGLGGSAVQTEVH